MTAGLTLVCPVRGRLKVRARSSDGLTPTEERFRVEAIKHLIAQGYPVENIRVEAVVKRFGNSGRNSFRADLAVLDISVSQLEDDSVDKLLEHAVVLGEVKRDNAEAGAAIEYQVKPMLDFAGREDCVALYWDDVEQRVFWTVRRGGQKVVRDGPLADLPAFGEAPGAKPLTFETIDSDKPLLDIFKRVEDILHSASIGPSRRFGTMLQLLLAKLYDEQLNQSRPTNRLTLQDFAALEIPPHLALDETNRLLGRAVAYYQRFLPEPVSNTLQLSGPTLIEVMRVLAPIKIIAMNQRVIQDFYMYFAKGVYKWDLAQYFTPTSLTEFIVELLNPQFGEHVKDPACGSADFLTAAYRRGADWPDYASSVWGSDVSPEAVQVAVLNMILNGDGKSNIQHENSLAKVVANAETCDVVVCNPPFGKRILERDGDILRNFELGHAWEQDDNGGWTGGTSVLAAQEAGILFAEACVRLLRPGGRLALVVPNGYLGNRSAKYLYLREWLLANCRLSAIVALPRFTFKSSGADVSASVIFCQKRENPLALAADTEEYEFAVKVINRVGWTTGDKKGAPTYKRDSSDGTFVLDDDDQLILDSDFDTALRSIRNSDAVVYSPWLAQNVDVDVDVDPTCWTVEISRVVAEDYLTLDPKRYAEKYQRVRNDIQSREHIRLGDIVLYLEELTSSRGSRVRREAGRQYKYVEIQDVETGSYRWQYRPGWDLPQRGRHFAEPGDIYVGGIWNSVRKWFLAGRDAQDVVVTNGMHRLRLKSGYEHRLLDLVVGLCSEAYGVQMRALARGSDGLAEIAPEDAANVVLPVIEDEATRAEFQPFVDQLLAGFTTIEAKVNSLLAEQRLPLPIPERRPDHTSIV